MRIQIPVQMKFYDQAAHMQEVLSQTAYAAKLVLFLFFWRVVVSF